MVFDNHNANVENWSEIHPRSTWIDGASELFYWMLLVTKKTPFSMYHFEIKLYTQLSIWKKWCMKNLANFFPCLAFHLTVVCTLDHDRLVDHRLSDNRTYILLFSCAYLMCNNEGSSYVFKWVYIPLILYQYISYIVPIFLFPKFLYSYISEARSCLTPCKPYVIKCGNILRYYGNWLFKIDSDFIFG